MKLFDVMQGVPFQGAVENVEIASQISREPMDAEQVLRQVGLEERIHNFPAQLSGGEQQRVAIARAIASNVDLIFADEPTGNLDTATEEEIIRIFRMLTEEFGKTVIVVTHSNAVSAMSDHRVLLEDGQLKELTE